MEPQSSFKKVLINIFLIINYLEEQSFYHLTEVENFEAYANRDSLKYRSIYGLDDIPTMYRGTIRKIGFSRAWNVFVQLGMTDDTYIIEDQKI